MTEEDLKQLYTLTEKSKKDRDLALKQYSTLPDNPTRKRKGNLVRYNPETDTYNNI